LSTGDNFTEIDFQKTTTTLIVGQNGAGKSTLLDALSFALFGKAHRNVNKPQLINSINGKGTVVEVEFTALGQNYKIIRGLKPNKFEIWQDSVMINQDSHAKEYQKVLEQNILKLNHKSFHQVVVLGSSSFTPFMQLSALHRREVIEDLLDINVFSKMNTVLKTRLSDLKDEITQNRHELDLTQTKIDAQKKHIEELQKISDNQREKELAELEELESELARLEEKITVYNDEYLKTLNEAIDATVKKGYELEKYRDQFGNKQKELRKEIKFYESNTTCPTCDQGIDEGLKQEKVTKATERCEEFEEARLKAVEQHGVVVDELNELESKRAVEQEDYEADRINRHEATRVRQRIQSLQGLLSREDGHQEHLDSLQTAKSDLESQITLKEEQVDRRNVLSEDREYLGVITELLKDTGIKTKIIKQYLPVINQLTNKYLQVLDFYVSFELDDTFKESIKSRHRDEFSYDSFSEGEKQRIDLALLFTWRQVAKMKNSVATNLLILDETFDSSLDADGVENLLKILDTLDQDTNVFIISHKGELLDNKFDRKIEFVKHKNFSRIAC
jgi:DNA repair exonuclease SbcCD ATPase subunit